MAKVLQISGVENVWLNEDTGELDIYGAGPAKVSYPPEFAMLLLMFLEENQEILQKAIDRNVQSLLGE